MFSFTKFSVLALAVASSVSAGLIVRQEETPAAGNSTTAGNTKMSFNDEGDIVFEYPSGSVTVGMIDVSTGCRESACQPFINQLPETCDSENCVFIPCTAEGSKNFEDCLNCQFDAAPADVTPEELAEGREYLDTLISGVAEGCAIAGTPLPAGTETDASDEKPLPETDRETPAPATGDEKPADEKPAAGNTDNNNAAQEEEAADAGSGALRTSSVVGAVVGAVGAVMIAL